MRRKIDKITIKEVRVLGSYGKMYHYRDTSYSLRKLSKDVKKSDATAIAIAALLLSQILTPNSVLIPIPQSSGNAEYTLELANAIRMIRQDCIVTDILSGMPRKKLYDIKKERASLKGVKTGLKVKGNADCKETLQSNTNIFLLDNVLNTGFTFNRARQALKKYVKIEPSLLAISATSNWINHN
jgi:predicted amidophosphoribosyltransferase